MIIKPGFSYKATKLCNSVKRIYEQFWYDVSLVIQNVSAATTSFYN